MKKYEAFIQSMTKKERANPQLFITDKTARSRAMRIAKGSGRSLDEATVFLAEFQQVKLLQSGFLLTYTRNEGGGRRL
jgi:signal recognition particle subunit SRP54